MDASMWRGETANGVPELVPARMVNEFSYCPRLFFLEWVQAVSPTASTPSRAATSTAGSIGRRVRRRCRFGRPALALDLAEEFRPLIAESVVLNLINNAEVSAGDFTVRAGGVALTKDGRRSVLRAYERRLDTEVRHPTFGYKVTYRRILEVQTRLLGAHVLGEVPEYVPLTTR